MSETIKAADLSALIGQDLEPSSWLEITQERVNQILADQGRKICSFDGF